ncbi:hypothetical protein BJ322DRAFT_1113378 [Thelephora terrestris]|uniref:Uncharacterized protein n=1 Tax=Thelephora terrestris TaxID=56493 RepID=A0A9P6H4X2_9AGAM|nr:hypothetical protein BJ322DRAFT_1113378 [Thelephora terrestris]
MRQISHRLKLAKGNGFGTNREETRLVGEQWGRLRGRSAVPITSSSATGMDQVSNLRVCYRILEDRTITALQTQAGDSQRLRSLRDDAIVFMVAVNDRKDMFPAEELELITLNIKAMVESLDRAEDQSIDLPSSPPHSISHLNYSGTPGRPRIEIDAEVLSNVLSIEPKTTLATVLGCSARTIRRRQQDIELQTGMPLVPQRSVLSENELDTIVTTSQSGVSENLWIESAAPQAAFLVLDRYTDENTTSLVPTHFGITMASTVCHRLSYDSKA